MGGGVLEMDVDGAVLFEDFLAGDGSDEIFADVEGAALHKMAEIVISNIIKNVIIQIRSTAPSLQPGPLFIGGAVAAQQQEETGGYFRQRQPGIIIQRGGDKGVQKIDWREVQIIHRQ